MTIKSQMIGAKKDALRELTLVRDEAKVRLHLLSLDAKQRWDELETAILALEHRANQEGERATDVLADKIRELGHQLGELITSHMAGSAGLLTNVRSIMISPVHSCSPHDSLNQVARIMWEQDCGIVPVVEQNQVVGLVTDRDICIATYTQGKAPSEIPVSSAMSSRVYGCSPDDSLGTALSLMTEQRVHRLPVLSGEGHLAGILALADVARFARSAGSANVDAALADTLGAISKRNEALPLAAE